MPEMHEEDLAYFHYAGFANQSPPTAVLGLLNEAGICTGTVVDLGCTGGYLLAALTAEGFRVVGGDGSNAALSFAITVAPGAELHCSYAEAFDLLVCRAVTALGEVLCYLSIDDLHALLEIAILPRVFDARAPGGLLIFDVVVREDANPFHYRQLRDVDDWFIDHGLLEDTRRHILCRNIILNQRVDGVW